MQTLETRTTRNIIVIILALGIFVSGCRSAGGVSESGNELQGTITISGAWALYPMVIRWREEFQKIHPDVQFDISAGGAGKGMADALSEAVDIGMVSRPIYPEEQEKGAFWVAVAKDAVFLTVNENNPVWDDLHQQGISHETLVGIYITGEITTWGQVVDRPDVTEAIHIFTRSDACGAANAWSGYLGGSQENLLGIGVYGDPGVLDAVIKDPLGIGFNNLNYAFDFDTGMPVAGSHVAPMDINGNDIADLEEVYDTKEAAVNAVALNYYPSPPARDLNLVTKGQPVGLSQAFIAWILADGQQYLVEMGYIALPQDKLDAALNTLGN